MKLHLIPLIFWVWVGSAQASVAVNNDVLAVVPVEVAASPSPTPTNLPGFPRVERPIKLNPLVDYYSDDDQVGVEGALQTQLSGGDRYLIALEYTGHDLTRRWRVFSVKTELGKQSGGRWGDYLRADVTPLKAQFLMDAGGTEGILTLLKPKTINVDFDFAHARFVKDPELGVHSAYNVYIASGDVSTFPERNGFLTEIVLGIMGLSHFDATQGGKNVQNSSMAAGRLEIGVGYQQIFGWERDLTLILKAQLEGQGGYSYTSTDKYLELAANYRNQVNAYVRYGKSSAEYDDYKPHYKFWKFGVEIRP